MTRQLYVRGRTLLFAAGAVAMWASVTRAALVTPAGVAGSSYVGTASQPFNLINDTTVTSPSSSLAAGNTGLWNGGAFSAGGPNAYNKTGIPVVANQHLVFTLPGVYNLTDAYLWQLNQFSGGAYYSRGVNQFDLSVSSDGVTYTNVLNNDTLAIATGAVTAQTKSLGTQNGVRFVKIGIDSAHSGAVNDYVGLTELRFEGSQVTAGPTALLTSATTGPGLIDPPSSVDLLQGKLGAASMGLQGGTLSQLTDGLGTSNLSHRVVPLESAPNTSTPFVLTYDASALGLLAGQTMNVDKINVFGYNTDGRRNQDFDVEYTLDGTNWLYSFIGASNLTPSNNVTLTSLAIDGTTDFITGARGLRFTFRPIAGTLHSSLIEIDAFGAIVPEPSSLAMMLFGVISLYLFRGGRR